jgi:arylsulfatase A-like enzyme
LLTASCSGEPQSDLGWPGHNVILISIDTLRADHLGCYGYPLPTSPNIDALANDAVLFSTTIAQAPSTTPSHASIFTSRIPVHHGAKRSTNQPISPQVPTMAEMLRENGYSTISFNGGGQVAAEFGFDRGFDLYESFSANQPFGEQVKSATDWMAAHPDNKFFMFLHSYEAHAPYDPEPEHLALFDSGYTGSLPPNISFTLLRRINDGQLDLTDQDAQHIKHAYDGEIRSVDEALGALLEYLKSVGSYDDTIVIFTSDHGEELGDHGQFGKHTYSLYDEVLRVPFILKLPGNRLASTRVDDQIRGIDLLPTVLDLIDIEAPEGLEGQSLAPLMLGHGEAPPFAVSQQDTEDAIPPTAIRSDKHKLIIRPPILDDENRLSQWFRDRAEFDYRSTVITLPIASAGERGSVEILFDGMSGPVVEIGPDRQNVTLIKSMNIRPMLPMNAGEVKEEAPANALSSRTITVRSTLPCIELEKPPPDTDESCVSFRLFNPNDFYLIDQDPAEQQNVYEDSTYLVEIEDLRAHMLQVLTQGMHTVDGDSRAVFEPETLEQLKSLGYIQ